MNKATEDQLSELHGLVARVLRGKLEDTITIMVDGPDGPVEKEISAAEPAVIAQAIKFLKDNDITSSIADDKNLSDLEAALKNKRENRSTPGGPRLKSVGGTE